MTTASTTAAAAGASRPGRPARTGGAAYWALVERIVDAAPPLDTAQRAAIRVAIHGCNPTRKAAAA